ncbi:oligopeptide/dipeptide ABC transporter, ATP-binding protein, C-terminal domain-containing protein [Streptosporangium canum]|uniref:Oligopeptide/dipeptide ABC transporter, ATP-binding protein, C-terminal domain-containing protein n=1 Tax=Streptosporangium canum TaxID=324952 RepID=A0A1I4EE03_9ACTN|nr:dipeptide/oligopeptide/nickel ABC transporter permease/ATP-binding protein [Streptosporangium canum]SFL03975.1 oligopeptide/dipeptide ABC transporter, ATP-binding protein, C-terminal domain-containing protein [Streptosporangium canum]
MFRPQLVSRLTRPGLRFSRLSPVTIVSLAVLAVVGLLALLAPLVAGDPLATGVPATPPGAEHWFGTDRAGRDVFARVAHGARSSLLVGLGATAVAVLAGAVLGSLAATSRKLVGEGIMRVLDVIMAFPPIALAAVLVAVFGRDLMLLTLTISFLYVPHLTRVVRANVLAQYGEVDAALARLAAVVAGREPRVAPLPDTAKTLLSVQDLTIRFPQRYGDVPVVQSLSFDVRTGEALGLVGESGCGKSLTSLAIMGLLLRGAQVSGRIEYGGRDILALPPRQRRAISGPEIAMVYQDAMSSLNPSVLVGTQLRQLTRRGGTRTPEELLELVGLDPRRTLRSYPHELSGGQRQRVLIAMALSRSPRLLVADEPTTALDVTVQAQVVELLSRLRDELGFAMVLVSHDLGLVGELVHRVAVMYAGQLAEVGTAPRLFSGVRHHYARGLLGSVLSLEAGAERLHQVPGVVPAPQDFGPGCRFAGRCAAATELCRTSRPELDGDSHDHAHACFHPGSQPGAVHGAVREGGQL